MSDTTTTTTTTTTLTKETKEQEVTCQETETPDQETKTEKPAESYSRCEEHKDYPKDLFCPVCGVSICRKCIETKEHIGHTHIDMTDASKIITEHIEDHIKLADENKAKKEEEETKLKKYEDSMEDTFSDAKDKIKECCDLKRKNIEEIENEGLTFISEIESKESEHTSKLISEVREKSKKANDLSVNLKKLKEEWENDSKRKKTKSELIEEYVQYKKECDTLEKEADKFSQEMDKVCFIKVIPRISEDMTKKLFEVRIFKTYKKRGEFTDEELGKAAKSDEKYKDVADVADEEISPKVPFKAFCVSDKTQYPNDQYCKTCNKFFCKVCKDEHKDCTGELVDYSWLRKNLRKNSKSQRNK